jgi:hypothetical protein
MRVERGQTWGWAAVLKATGETDASLRRDAERGLVKLPTSSGGRTRATLTDIAVFKVRRFLKYVGYDAKRALDLAEWSVRELFKYPGVPPLLYLVAPRVPSGPDDRRIFPLDIDVFRDPRKYLEHLSIFRQPNYEGPGVPINYLVIDAFRELSDVPADVLEWGKAQDEQFLPLIKEQTPELFDEVPRTEAPAPQRSKRGGRDRRPRDGVR